MLSTLLFVLLNLILITSLAQAEGTCSTISGFPGRDGRDGQPGRDGIPGLPGTCSDTDVQQIKADIQREMEALVYKLVNETYRKSNIVPETCNNSNTDCPEDFGMTSTKPANSCQEIYQRNPLAPSGSYWILTEDDDGYHVNLMYCDMDSETLLNGTRGWTRVAYINMTEDGAQCPTSLQIITSPKNLCTRRVSNTTSCSSVTFPTGGLRYSKICGQAVGYQHYSMDAFQGSKDINSHYVDGMSITYGSPRKHVWTYAVGLSDDYNYYGKFNCPCAKYPGPAPPSFVEDHYYCEAGNTGRHEYEHVLYDDPLWDGAGCGAGNSCCSQPGMPWFCRTLSQEVEEDIEVRICADESNEDLYLELLAIYIQ